MRLFLAVALALVSLSAAHAQPQGRGIFSHVYKASGANRWQGWNPAELVNTPGFAGTQFSSTWAQYNPAPGVYDWSRLDTALELWDSGDKRLWIEIQTANHSSTGNVSMPDHVFSDLQSRGLIVTSPSNGSVFPVFWDDYYQNQWRGFLEVFAERYDGDPRIEFISAGGYSSRHEPRLASRENDATMPQWTAYGFDNWTAGGTYWSDGIAPIMDIYEETFTETNLAMTMTLNEGFSQALLEKIEDLDWIGVNNGFSVRTGSQDSREVWDARTDQYGERFGYSEFGPAGRDNKGTEPLRSMAYIYERALGYNGHLPTSDLSYLPMGNPMAEVETVQEWIAAMQEATEHLVIAAPFRNDDPPPVILGDLNSDGQVNSADAAIMFGQWNGSGAADLDADGMVNAVDAGILFGNWSTTALQTQVVPESSTLGLALSGALGLLQFCRSKRGARYV